jgi:hypothetical protein
MMPRERQARSVPSPTGLVKNGSNAIARRLVHPDPVSRTSIASQV